MKLLLGCTLAIGMLLGANQVAALTHEEALQQFEDTLALVHEQRTALGKKRKSAHSSVAREAVRDKARQFIISVIVERIIPAWLGTPWTMAVINDGLKPDAKIPHEQGKGISCSWFVVSVLENAGLRLLNPRRFAGTIAIHFQRSLSPRKKDLRRYWNITPAQLYDRFIGLGDGLYVIGLNCHIGFVHVSGKQVNFLHSNYLDPNEVIIEPLLTSEAIAYSQEAGYVVSALFKDPRLVDHWLLGTKVPFASKK